MVGFTQKIKNRVKARSSLRNDRKKIEKSRLEQLFDYKHVKTVFKGHDHEDATVFDGVDIPSGSNTVFYGDRVNFSGLLPSYEPYDTSSRCYLTFVDCHQALIASVYKARLLLFELERQVFGLKGGRLVLHGTPRHLDEKLVKDVTALEDTLYVPQHVGSLLENLLSAHLRLHPRFEMHSGQSYMRSVLVGIIVSDMTDS